ncbi:hypothetical protein PENTCL1PPCAC_23364 [Pristionchus entomophagus]|uniref:MATH domain-containing protein n=1 Tax=Pristionchus entomophagus TaxID=358040 RepID=A0AAV5U314_9BILA|nr:hypothetical protein PENTCL1PPCAC_23364 [Pristionchus entomophagus]
MISPFMCDKFAVELVKVGIQEVTFSYSSKSGRAQEKNEIEDRSGHSWSIELLLSFFGAGIERVNTSETRSMNREQLDDLIDKLAALGKSLKLEMNLSFPNQERINGRYYGEDDDKHGRFVHVTRTSFLGPDHVTIEYNRDKRM